MQAEDSPGIIQQILSGCREHGSARLPAEQVTIEARLEPFDLVADGRLRKAQASAARVWGWKWLDVIAPTGQTFGSVGTCD